MGFIFRGDPRWLRRHPIAGDGDGRTNGYAELPGQHRPLTVLFSDGLGWEHVSVSTRGRPPNWEEMCAVKNLFWDVDDVVMQLHPARAEYVNLHPHCLHLWRPSTGVSIPTPPRELVGW
jgi:hypothetical protein